MLTARALAAPLAAFAVFSSLTALGTRDPGDSWQQHFADTQPALPVSAELQPWLSDENALDLRGRLLE